MSPTNQKARRILYAEDAFDQAVVIKSFLQSVGGVQVVHAQDGDSAANLVKSQEWDLLITDLNLPGLDGFDLCRIAKAAHPSLPVLAVTGYTGAHYHEQAFRAGATELLAKPVDREEFLAKVGELTGLGSGMAKPNVLAVGALVGDVEMGCGGSLIRHRDSGADVTIAVLCRDELDDTGAGLTGAPQAAAVLGARLVLEPSTLDDPHARSALLDRLVRDLHPIVAYIPAMDDAHPGRRETFRVARDATAGVSTVFGYQTATTGLGFRPTYFRDVADVLVDKMEALTAYQEAGLRRLDLAPRLAQAYARYWGRLERFSEVEAFEKPNE